MAGVAGWLHGRAPAWLSTQYSRQLFLRLTLQVLLLALVIEAIFLSERSVSIIAVIVDEPVSLARALPLLAWSAPEVYLAIPIVLMIGIYLVLLRCRERREFIALASGGQSTLALVRTTVTLALFSCLFSLFVSGIVYPHAQYAFRVDRDVLRYDALSAGGAAGRFLHFPDYSIYIFPSGEPLVKRPIFVRQALGTTSYRIITADRSELLEDRENSRLTVRLLGATVTTFGDLDRLDATVRAPADAEPCPGCDNVNTLKTSSLERQLDLSDFAQIAGRGATLAEWTTPELLGWHVAPTDQGISGAAAESLRRLSRGLLCVIAPFVAWIALMLTTQRTQIVALPLACIALMGADIALSQLVSVLAPIGLATATLILLAFVFGPIVLAFRYVLRHQDRAVFPTLARA